MSKILGSTPSPPAAASSEQPSPVRKSFSNDTEKETEQRSNSPAINFSHLASAFHSIDSFKSKQQQQQQPSTTSRDSHKTFPTSTSGLDAETISEKDAANNSQQFCLKWNNYQRNLTCVFDQLLQNESFVDVTLACDGNSIKAHKMVLSACSPYFQSLFVENPCQHPIIIMRDVKWTELKAAVEFMYKGEIKVSQAQIGPLLRVAEMLKIRGLTEVNGEQEFNTTAKMASPNPDVLVSPPKKSNLTNRIASNEYDLNSSDLIGSNQINVEKTKRHKRVPSGENRNVESPQRRSTPESNYAAPNLNTSVSTLHQQNTSPTVGHQSNASTPLPLFPMSTQSSIDGISLQSLGIPNPDDMEIKPGIAEMIREEERVSELQFIS